MKTKRLAVDAVLSAMCAVLGAVAIDLNSIKITLESFPVLLGALLFGPVDGMAIGFVGTFLYQLLRYGISATTMLWILPYAAVGWLAGRVPAQFPTGPRNCSAHGNSDNRTQHGGNVS